MFLRLYKLKKSINNYIFVVTTQLRHTSQILTIESGVIQTNSAARAAADKTPLNDIFEDIIFFTFTEALHFSNISYELTFSKNEWSHFGMSGLLYCQKCVT